MALLAHCVHRLLGSDDNATAPVILTRPRGKGSGHNPSDELVGKFGLLVQPQERVIENGSDIPRAARSSEISNAPGAKRE